MKALLWKDFRLHRLILIMGLALFLGPFLIVIAAAWRQHWPTLPPVADWPHGLLPAALVSIGLSLLTLVTLAGNSIASERADRSAEFLAYLPPSRRQILASKLLTIFLPITLVWAFNLILAGLLTPENGPAPGGVGNVGDTLAALACCAMLLFGAAFLGSALLDSPAIATSLGIGAMLAFIFTFAILSGLAGWSQEQLKFRSNLASLTLGAGCFACAAACYLRRVEP